MYRIENTNDLIAFIFIISFIVVILATPYMIYRKIQDKKKENEEKIECYCYIIFNDSIFNGVAIRDIKKAKEFKSYFSEDNFNGKFFIPYGNSFIMDTMGMPVGMKVVIIEKGDDLYYIRFKNKSYNPDSDWSKKYTYGYIPKNQLHDTLPE